MNLGHFTELAALGEVGVGEVGGETVLGDFVHGLAEQDAVRKLAGSEVPVVLVGLGVERHV